MNKNHLPLVVDAGGLSLVQTRGAVRVKSAKKTGNTERSAAIALGICLLQFSNISSDVLKGGRILDSQFVRLALNLRPIDQYSSVGSKSCS
jgi:hypothetical protein